MVRRFLDSLRHLVDVLIEGFTTLNQRLWVLVIPLGLDLFLWAGLRISPHNLAEALTSTADGLTQFDPDLATQVTTALRDWGNQANLVHLLSAPLTPVLIPRLSTPALPYAPLVWTPPVGWVVLVSLLALPLSLLLWSLYLIPLADIVRGTNESGLTMLRRIPRTWWRMLQLLVLGLVAVFLFFTVASLLIAITSALLSTLGSLVFYLAVTLALWVILYFYFTPEAILFSGINPLRAILYSLQIVRTNLGLSIGFVLLTFMIRIGTTTLWQRLAGSPLGVLLSIVVNTYIAGGLATAALIFYRERLQRWLAAVDRQKKRTVL